MPEKKKSTVGEVYDERAGALMRAMEARRPNVEYPSERLPPYRQKFAEDVADFEQLIRESREDTYSPLGQRGRDLARTDAEKAASWDIEEQALRRQAMPVTMRDVDAMRDLLRRPGETSSVRDYIDLLPEDYSAEGNWDGGYAQALERDRRARRVPTKKGK